MNTWTLVFFLLGQTTLDQANKVLLEGNYQQAYSLYQEVLKQNPNQYEALANAAFTASKLGKSAEAFDLYWRAWQIKRDFQRVGKPLVDLGLQLGTKYTLEKNWKEAERVFRIVTNVAPDNAVAWFNLGYALEQQGKLEEALAAYRKARDLNPSNTVTAALNRVQGELDRQRSARLNTFRRRAERALSRGDTTLALALMDSVLRIDPRNTWARNTRAQILEQQNTQAQIDSLRQVLASLLATDSLKALPVVEALLSLVPQDSQLRLLQHQLQSLRQRTIQEIAQVPPPEDRGFPTGIVVGVAVVLLLAVGAVLLLRGKKGEEVPTAVPSTGATSAEPEPQPPPPVTPPVETVSKREQRIRVIEGLSSTEESSEEPVPRDVIIHGKEDQPREEVGVSPAEPEEKPKPSEELQEKPLRITEEKPAPQSPKEPKEEAVAAAAHEPAAPAAGETPPKPKPVAEAEEKPVGKQKATKPIQKEEKPKETPKPESTPARPIRAQGFGGVNAIKERAKKKRRLLLLQMLRDALAEGKEGVFGSKEMEAYIYMKEGKILQAEYKGKSGEEALQAILENPKPDRFSFREKDTFFVEGDLNLTVDDLDRQIEELRKEV